MGIENKGTFANTNPIDAMHAAAARRWLAKNGQNLETEAKPTNESQSEKGSQRFDGKRKINGAAPDRRGFDTYGSPDPKFRR